MRILIITLPVETLEGKLLLFALLEPELESPYNHLGWFTLINVGGDKLPSMLLFNLFLWTIFLWKPSLKFQIVIPIFPSCFSSFVNSFDFIKPQDCLSTRNTFWRYLLADWLQWFIFEVHPNNLLFRRNFLFFLVYHTERLKECRFSLVRIRDLV